MWAFIPLPIGSGLRRCRPIYRNAAFCAPRRRIILVVWLRPATIEDIDVILEHRLAIFRELGNTKPEELVQIERVSREYFESSIPTDAFHAVLAELPNAGIVGGGGVIVVPWPGACRRSRPQRPWILNVYVRPEFRRRGVARAIIENLIQWCRSRGFDSVSLHASDNGRPLYEAFGFTPTNEMRLNLQSDRL
jgi:GNAT superfamily N-acetyltransferase